VDLKDLHRRAAAEFGRRVHAVGEDEWHAPTPNPAWDVRDLVGHLVSENRWAPPLLAGKEMADVGDALDGDLLGDDPVRAWDESVEECLAAVAACDLAAPTHLSFGTVPAEEYVGQLYADLLVHAWDLAAALGREERLDPQLVDTCADWFTSREELYRQAGVIASRPDVAGDADPQTALLAAFGRDSSPASTLAVITRFNAAFGRRDVDAVMANMTDDCVFENTSPPDGTRYEGQAAVRRAWTEFFASSPGSRFVTEEGVVAGDRAVYRWRYTWDDGHVRGVDVFAVRDGKVAEKLSYVKG
jgi:uncharacterized protein (TIGR03086 family)